MEKRSKSRIRSSQSKTSPKKISSGKLTRNPFLNFLRDFRKSNRHKYDVCELTKRGARLWRGMTDKEKSPYVNLSKRAPKYKRTKKRRRRRRTEKKKKKRRRRSRSRSSSVPTGESTDGRSPERDRKRRGEKRKEKREERRRGDRHSHSHDSGNHQNNHRHEHKECKLSNSKEKRNDEYELKYKNSKYEDTRDFI